MFVTGHRLDQPALHNEVRVVADDLNEEHVAGAFRKFGEVSSCVRGAASISRMYKPGHILGMGRDLAPEPQGGRRCSPSYIMMDEDSWQ